MNSNNEEICLAIDATNRWVLAGLYGPGVNETFATDAPRESFRLLFPALRTMLDRHGVSRPDWIAAALGPGSFTGVRMGVGAARSLAQLWRIPVSGANSIHFYCYDLAARTLRDEDVSVAVLLDGKQRRVYAGHAQTAALRAGRPGPEPRDIAPEEFLRELPPGTRVYADDPQAVASYCERSADEFAPLPAPSPAALCALTRNEPRVEWSALRPLYLREDPAHAKYPRGMDHGSRTNS